MNWASTMAGNADDAANDPVPVDDGSQPGVASDAWDPHQVWLTRVKQPRDDLRRSPNPSPDRSTSGQAGVRFWTRATR